MSVSMSTPNETFNYVIHIYRVQSKRKKESLCTELPGEKTFSSVNFDQTLQKSDRMQL